MSWLKNVRIYAVLALVLLSAYLIFSPYIFKKSGVVVSFLDKVNQCSNVKEGDVINQVGGTVIVDSQNFETKTKNIVAGAYTPMIVNGGPAGCVALGGGYLGLGVSDVSNSQIKLSPEIGKTILTKFKVADSDKTKEVLSVIKDRIAILKLAGYKAETENGIIKITSLDKDITQLTKSCNFEIDINRKANLPTQSSSTIILNGKKYAAGIYDSKIMMNGTEYPLGNYVYIDNIETKFAAEDNKTVAISQVLVNGSDAEIAGVHSLQYYQQISGFRLQVPLSISSESTARFVKITAGIKPIFIEGVSVLDATFAYKLDNKTISELPIPSEISQENITTVSVVAFGRNMDAMQDLWNNLQLCLNSGPLDIKLEKVSTETLEPSAKSLAELSITVFLISALIISFLLVQIRYKAHRCWYALAGLALAEMFIVFGFLVAVQKYTIFLIDLVTVNGFAVFGAVSVGQMLFGMEYFKRNNELSLSYRMKKFGRINLLINLCVFLAAVALMFFARGFGFVMLFGVVVGAVLTKPIFFNMLTKLQM